MNSENFRKLSFTFNILFVSIIFFIGIYYLFKLYNNNQIDKEYTVVMFGNSITAGGNWNELVGRADLLNSGYPGYTSSHLKRLAEEGVIIHKPKICFIMVGINDILIGDPIHGIKANYIEILNRLLENNITPVVQSILYGVNNPRSKIMIDSMNTFLLRYCNDNKIKYLDLNFVISNSQGLNPENSTDGLHLNQRAYKLWAIEVKRVLNTFESEQY